jgi:putative ribosome biogenesis GTPase RsgA
MQFNRFFFDGKAILTSSPNNPGVEVEPILRSNTNERISFQAKYFTGNIDYSSIDRSMKTTIENYKGRLDVIYLYCNRDFSHTAKSFRQCKDNLHAVGIRLETVTNVEILNQIMDNQYSVIAARYFANESLNVGWFKQKAELSLRDLEPRYTCGFNVELEYEKQLGIFVYMQEAVDYFNAKKAKAIKTIKDIRSLLSKYYGVIDEIIIQLQSIPDINTETICACLDWSNIIRKDYIQEIDKIKKDFDELLQKAHLKDNENHHNMFPDPTYLRKFLDALDSIHIDELHRTLLQNKVLIVSGDAGIGKSHLLGTFTEVCVGAGYPTILLLGQAFLSDHTVEQQICEHLGFDLSFDEFLDILD